MSIVQVVNGNSPGNDITALWWNQYSSWLTGGITDTPFIFSLATAGGTVLELIPSSAATSGLDAYVGADADPWFRLLTTYKIALGPGGSAPPDVFLFRSNATELTITGNLVVSGTLKSGNTGNFSYAQMAVTAKNTSDAFELPWFDSNINCPVVYLDGQSSSPGQITFGGRLGGSAGQKDVVWDNATSGWYIWYSNGGQYHFQDSNYSNSDPLAINAGSVYSHNVQWCKSGGYGQGTMKFLGTFSGGKATIAHGLGYTPTICHVIPWFNNSNASGTYATAVSATDGSNVYVNVSGTTNTNVYAG